MKRRYFEPQDAAQVLSWISSEREFRQWSADQYGDYPIRPEEMIENYKNKIQEGEFYPLIFEDKGKVIGHLILRYPTTDKKLIRLGFIIVDSKKRQKGYGTKIIFDAMKYASSALGATKFCLGVFTNNVNAYKCYKNIGFEPIEGKGKTFKFHDEEWTWEEMLYDPTQKIVQYALDHVVRPVRNMF